MNLPECLYKKMVCMDEEDLFASEELKNEIEKLDRYKYITLEIFAYIDWNRWTGKQPKYILHHYKISFRNIYRLNSISCIGKIIFAYQQCTKSLGNYKENVERFKCIIEHIRKEKKLEPITYDSYKACKSGPSIRNITNKSKRFQKYEIERLNNRGIKCDDIELTEFTYTCRDLHSEELDKLIYPNEYLDKKYLEF